MRGGDRGRQVKRGDYWQTGREVGAYRQTDGEGGVSGRQVKRRGYRQTGEEEGLHAECGRGLKRY